MQPSLESVQDIYRHTHLVEELTIDIVAGMFVNSRSGSGNVAPSKTRQQKGNDDISRRDRGSHFRLPPTAFLYCPIVPPLLPAAPLLRPFTPLCSFIAPPCSPSAPPVLPLKRPCSLSRSKTAILNPKFGNFI